MSGKPNISIILVNPQGSMNIGMAARAMKNCGITNLKLVNPVNFKPKDAHMMACSARNVVDEAKLFSSLDEALHGEACSAAFSRRMAKTRAPYYSLDDVAPVLAGRAEGGRVALVFGRETDGLTREELYRCDFRVYIPTSKEFGSLNLAQAVLLAAHALFKKTDEGKTEETDFFSGNEEISPMIGDFEKLLFEIGYDHKDDEKLRNKIVQAFREICGRAGLRHKDVNMFLGIWAMIRKNLS
ncbi:MAG: hypothetical protein A3I09_00895 [Deltaproteobacteria bacterium RIFCSPLOWO2_02_FULL_47_10]|nr:MAG: hypothetical protein A3I09_00895 [Deltaproteobacteria bacterium RIFCSPLOWO2_02_FULL_47_10]